jgi:hypothetical protein
VKETFVDEETTIDRQCKIETIAKNILDGLVEWVVVTGPMANDNARK